MNQESQESALAKKTFLGMAWAYSAFFSGKLFTFISTAVMARILIPQDFGLIAFALILLNFIDATRSFGINDALIYNTERQSDAADTAFIINMSIGFLQYAVTFLIAPFMVRFTQDARIVGIVQVMGISFMINAVGQTHQALLQKELKFQRRFMPEVLAAFGKGLVSIAMVWLGFGAWSLVIGYIVGASVNSIVSWAVLPWKPTLHFYADKARDLWHYGMHILMLNALSIAVDQADPLIVGMLLGTVQLSYYSLASKIPDLIVMNFTVILTKVIFATYVKIKDNRELLMKGFFMTTKYTAFVTVAAGVGMAAVAPDLIHVSYGKQWEPAIILLQVLALSGTASTLAWNAGDVFKAIGRPDISTKLLFVETIYTIGLVWVFASNSHLAVMAATANFLALSITAVIRLALASYFLKFNVFTYFKVFRGAFISALVMYLGVTFWRTQVSSWPRLEVLISAVTFGALIYTLCLLILEREDVIRLWNLVRGLISRKKALVVEPEPAAFIIPEPMPSTISLASAPIADDVVILMGGDD